MGSDSDTSGSFDLDLDATIGLAGTVEDVIVASASVRSLRGMPARERDWLAHSQLTPREAERYQALAAFAKRQLEWLAGRLAAKRSVAELIARSGARPLPSEIEILQDGRATRPYVACDGVHVGISHSFDVALAAAAPHAVGVDVELVRPLSAELIDYAFAPSELDPLGSDAAAMVRLWTMKEAFVKMLGLGVPAFDDLRLVSCERGRSQWLVRGRVADELATRQPRCWAVVASGYAIALTWSVPQL